MNLDPLLVVVNKKASKNYPKDEKVSLLVCIRLWKEACDLFPSKIAWNLWN